ncbi:hypothetical protein [Aeromicrobium yanjiei]|uniref:Uncharacterized protein n=1 Tax=Aeromicrobium yanjiei TaxID=2662028 RepID=A0A5Q2MI47_9ACTN|nr:hypothetical protein [Aeromicrobium yanjiei]QGG42338.1 hypothetical protein GEV26_13680 [Aeromicrobium yanjiei]
MTDVGRNETVQLDEDDSQVSIFQNHCAFDRISTHWIEADARAGHDPKHDQSVKTMPTPFDRTSQDDIDRTQDDLVIQLSAEVDAHCLDVLLSTALPVDDVDPTQINQWVRQSILETRLGTRSQCGVDIVVDGELEPLLTTINTVGPRAVDVGWERANVYAMNRYRPIDAGLYVVVNLQHVIGMSTRATLFYTSHSLDEGTEYLSARCDLTYRPRLDFHPGAVRVARVAFADEAAWRTAARAAALD